MIFQPQSGTAPQSSFPDVSLVIPVYNESGRIGPCLEQLTAWIARRSETFDIIVVDDGSNDDTALIADRWARTHPSITLLQEPHRGKANAVIAGLRFSRGTIVGFLDVDLATPIQTWDAFAIEFQRGADIVIASREGTGATRIGEPWYRHAMGRAFNGIIRLLLLPGVNDTQCGFKFFTRRALTVILPRTLLYRSSEAISRPRVTAFDVEILFIAKQHHLRTSIIPVTWSYGEHTKVNPLTDTLQNLSDVIQVRLNGWLGRYR